MKVGKQTTVFDVDTGEVFNETITFGSQNGDGWVIVYRESYADLLLKVPDLITLKVFGFLMTKQVFDDGISTTKQAIANDLKISYVSTMKAFKWLKENKYIKERKIHGQTQFLLNPDVTTCGKNRKAKLELWNSI